MQQISIQARALYYFSLFFVFAALLTPLIVFPQWLMFPFITSKVFFFRITALFGFSGTLLLLMYYPALRTRITKLQIAWVVYAIAIILSGIFGVDFYRSWWSGHERMLGIFSVLHYIVYGWTLTILLRGWDGGKVDELQMIGWRTWFVGLGFISFVVACMGLLQRFGNNTFLFVEPGGRVYSTLGNFIYLGNFMLTSLWIFGLLIVQEARRNRRYIYGAMMAPLFFAFLFSGSRGAMFGALMAAICSVFTIACVIEKKWRIKIFSLAAVLIVLVTLLYATPLGNVFGTQGTISRLFSIGNDVTPRFIAWNVAIDAWKDFPIFGWGFENFFIAFNTHFNPRSLEFSFYETWFDSAHNIVLNTLATTGIVGLLAYFGLYVTGVIVVLFLVRKNAMARNEAIILIGLLYADFGSKLFVFDHPTSYLVLFGVLAYISHRSQYLFSTQHYQGAPSRFRAFMSFIVLCATLIFLFSTTITPLHVNTQTVRALQDIRLHPQKAFSTIERLMRRNTPHMIDVRNDIARDVRLMSFDLERVLGRDEFVKLVSYIRDELNRAHMRSPRDLIIVMAQADMLQLLSSRGDEKAFAQLQERYEYAFLLSPRRQQLYYLLSRALAERGEIAKAIALLDKAIAINPNVAYSYWLRGIMRAQSGADIFSAFEDVYRATQTLLFVPQNISEIEGTSAVYMAAGFSRLNYDSTLLHKYEGNSIPAPWRLYERMITTAQSLGIHSFVRELLARAHTQYKENTIKITGLNIADDLLKIKKGITKYQESGRTPPLDLYYALLFVARHQNNVESINATRAEMRQYYTTVSHEQVHDRILNCFMEGNSFDVFQKCLLKNGV